MSKAIPQQSELELNKDGSAHGRIVYSWGESQYCSTYCPGHVRWLLDNGYDIIPEHNEERCAGFDCGHGSIRVQRITNKVK